MNVKADFLQNESIHITNHIDSNRELECSTTGVVKVGLNGRGRKGDEVCYLRMPCFISTLLQIIQQEAATHSLRSLHHDAEQLDRP